MAILFDRIVVTVPELPAAVDQYQRLFGVPPLNPGQPLPPGVAWWDLRNTVIELVQGDVARPRVQGIVFSVPEPGAHDSPVANTLGIDLRVCDGSLTASARRANAEAGASGFSVDHLVLRTGDAQACIDLFAGELGLRLALDKTAPQWGGRMLFFRAGKLTLEVIAADKEPPEGAYFWGLAYACPDLEQRVPTLEARGVSVSAVREGRKPGTAVATVKSHCLEIPTLLIQPAK
jgi:catechol 2,3-dioxygenase-like lactoylglutathione lyase family enzyme